MNGGQQAAVGKIWTTRFAPSPTGPLHLGHAYSALLAHDMARAKGGRFLLRIEDIDHTRSRPHWEDAIYEDLAWLGLSWDGVLRQSDRRAAYDRALDALWQRGLVYACTCTRRDIQTAVTAPQEGDPPFGPDGIIYPGTCRPTTALPKTARPTQTVLRLNLRAVHAQLPETHAFGFTETGHPKATARPLHDTLERMQAEVGDIVLSRRDFAASYHLSVVLDDAHQGVSHVVRGRDLADATPIHVVLQRVLGLPTPIYHHHRLIRDAAGKRLAKRDNARALRTLRDAGLAPADIRAQVGL
ncbi:MAG: tRNA glutamyl-Q(34) synthetase GluQRS [Paracoccaceae bacterium]